MVNNNEAQLDVEHWKAIDDYIVAHSPLLVVKLIREVTGMSIHEAGKVLHERYSKLRQTRPGDFTCSHERYWDGWYS